MTGADRKLIAGIILIALLGFAGNHAYAAMRLAKASRTLAVIKAEGKVVRTIALKEDTTESLWVAGRLGPEKVEVQGKRIRIIQSPCPDQICVRQGWISSPGQSIVCVPGRIVIYIEGESAVDAILR